MIYHFFKNWIKEEVHNEIDEKANNAIEEVREDIKKDIEKFKYEIILIVLFTISTMLIAPYTFEINSAKVIVSIVLILTTFYTIYGTYKIRFYFINLVIKHHFNIKQFIFQTVHAEVNFEIKKKMEKLYYLEGKVNDWVGKGEKQLTHEVTQKLIKVLIKDALSLLIVFTFSLLLYTFYIRDMLLETINLTFFKALIYPFS